MSLSVKQKKRGGKVFANDYAKLYCIKYDYCKSDNGGGGFQCGQELTM